MSYIDEVRAVIVAGQRLENAMAEDPPVRRAAARNLESALARQETGTEALSALMFTAAERPPAAGTPSLGSEETLGSVLLELQVANVSLSAGALLGEAGTVRQPERYQEALQELRSTAKELEGAAAGRVGAAPDGQLGFRRRPARDAGTASSGTVAEARTTLSTTFDRTFAGIVDESRTMAVAVWDQASELPGSKVLDDVIGLARDLRFPVDDIGRLIAFGLRKLRAAIDALKRLFRLADVGETRPYLEQLWGELPAAGDLLRPALLRVYGVDRAMSAKARAIAADLPVARLDAASSALGGLAERFRATMQIARKLLGALVVASEFVGALVVLLPGVNLHHLALTAAGLLLLLTSVVLSGMDYTDSGTVLGRVHGVRSVLSELAT